MRLRRIFHPPGTAPGTVTVPPEPVAPARAKLTSYTATEIDELELDTLDPLDRTEQIEPGRLTWLDVEGHDAALISEIGTRLEIHPLVVEDVVNVGQRPKVEEYDGCLFMVLELAHPDPDTGRMGMEQVSLVLQAGLLVSFSERQNQLLDPVRARLRAGKGRIRKAGLDYLAYALIDAVVDHYFPVLDAVGSEIEQVEEKLIESPSREDLSDLHRLRRHLVLMRRSVWPLREMLSRLLHSDSPLIRDETGVFLRDVADHLALIADMIETYRDMVSGLMELYMTAISNRMNEVMKVLTIIATIFIPLSFVAGVYGMNFNPEASPWNMPELSWYWGYPSALGLMAVMATGLVAFFRRRGWV